MKTIDMGPTELTRDSKTFIPDVERVFHEGSLLECLTHEGLFNPDECAEIIKTYGYKEAFFSGSVNAEMNSDEARLKDSVRNGLVRFLEADEQSMWIYEKILAVISSANDHHYQFDIDHFDAIQLGRYEVGGYYNNHIDIGPGRMGNRKLSMTVQLSDPDNYSGGDLVMSDLSDFHASRSIGSVTVFPSFLEHRVEPITKGTRFSLVAWVGGKHRFK